jgi:hypothetical protein
MSIILFYTSFILIVLLFAVKYYEIQVLRHEALVEMVKKHDEKVHEVVSKGKAVAKKIHFKNAHRLALLTTDFIKKESIALKRKFDSNQPKFFLMPPKPGPHKGSASFFLKKVSDYKDSLTHKDL